MIFSAGITILWSIAIYFLLVPDPVRVKSFSYRAKYILVARLRTNNSGVRNTKWKKDQVMELLTDLKFWLAFWMGCLAMVMSCPLKFLLSSPLPFFFSFLYFFQRWPFSNTSSSSSPIKVCNGALSTFMPLVIAGFGFSSLNALLLTMPAGAYCGTVVLLAAYLAMKFEHIRTWIIALAQALSTGAAVLLWQLPTSERGWLLFAMYLLPSAAAGYCVLMGLQIANTAGYTKRALASSGIFVGYCKFFSFFFFFLCLFVYWTKKKGGRSVHSTHLFYTRLTHFFSNSFVLLFLLSRHRKFRRTLHLSRKRTSQIRHRIRHYLDHGGDFRAPRYCISIRMYTG